MTPATPARSCSRACATRPTRGRRARRRVRRGRRQDDDARLAEGDVRKRAAVQRLVVDDARTVDPRNVEHPELARGGADDGHLGEGTAREGGDLEGKRDDV